MGVVTGKNTNKHSQWKDLLAQCKEQQEDSLSD